MFTARNEKRFIGGVSWLFLFLILLTMNSFAEWHHVEPIEYRSSINSIDHFSSTSIVVAAADSGFIYRSTDAGTSWIRVNITSENWNDIACHDDQMGIIVGDYGNLRVTYDAGETWEILTEVTPSNLNSVALYDSLHFLIGGNNGEIWVTEDGGSSWSLANTPYSINIKALNYGTLDTIFAAAGNQVWKSTNNGADWVSMLQFQYDLADIKFIDGLIGFTCERSSRIYRTLDGGVSWDTSSGIGTFPMSMIVEDADNLKVLSKRGYFYQTDGSFYSWSSSRIGGSFSDMTLIDGSNRIVAVGGEHANYDIGPGEIIAISNDLGDTWEYASFQQHFPLNSLCFINENEGYAAGGSNFQDIALYPDVILHTIDGGLNWEIQLAETGGNGIRDIYFLNESTGWAVSGNRCWQTSNGGDLWTEINSSGNSIMFINEIEGWISDFGTIKHTTDGGNTWSYQDPPSGNYDYLYSILFIDSQTGWSTGYNWPSPFHSIILKTTDGGSNWNYQYNPDDGKTIRSIDMWSDQIGIAVSSPLNQSIREGKILMTLDGGQNWDQIISPDSIPLNAVMYMNENEIWAAGGHGDIIYSTDSGHNWNVDTVLANQNIYDLFAINGRKYVSTLTGEFFYNFDQTGVDDRQTPNRPKGFKLLSAYPNPFNGSTTISYSLPQRTEVIVEIYDILGRKIETLFQGEQQAGHHHVVWDASEISSGMYFYRIQAGEYIETKKMVLLK